LKRAGYAAGAFSHHFDIVLFPRPSPRAEVLGPIESKLKDLQDSLPPGYQVQIAGEKGKHRRWVMNLAVVLLISLVGSTSLCSCNSRMPFKPCLCCGRTVRNDGSVDSFGDHGYAFGFMAFLGVASLIASIVTL